MQVMNFYFDICALIIISTLLLSTFFKKSSAGRTNRLFIAVMALILISAVLKISFTGIVALEYSEIALNAAYFTGYFYLIVKNLIFPFAVLLLLSSVGIYKSITAKPFFRIFMSFFSFFPLFLIVLNVFTKKFFFISGAMVLYESSLMLLFFVPNLAFMLAGIFILFIYRKSIPLVKVSVALIIFAINFMFAFSYRPGLYKQIELFVLSNCAFLIYLFTRRPELFINKTVNTKSAELFGIETRQTFLLGRRRNVIFVKILNYSNISMYIGQENYRGFLEYVSDILFSITYPNRNDFDIYYIRDAFFVIVSDSSDFKMIKDTASRINEVLIQNTVYSDFELHPEACVCLLTIPDDINDINFYEYFLANFHKIIGKTEVPLLIKDAASSMEFKIKSQIEKIISDAFENHHFEVFFQPAWGVKEKRFVSGEALLRLKDPVYGYIPPSIFIPVAEENGLIYRLGEFVLKSVCRFIASPEFAKLGLEYIEINLSKNQCVQKDLVDVFLENINDYGISPEQIRFEITEDSADNNAQIVEQNINALHNLGVSFALDDYGTGYSNIKKVTSFPLSVVKLDKSFVDEIHNPVMWSVIQDTIHMLKALKLEVFIEGIEDKKTAETFEKLNVDSIQGYYYSTPLPEEDFIKFIRLKNKNGQ
jgi:EAL domain-containing protein (putative c-di-GMP-specific phosphodiesterase class I)